jgi:hypothetical protein
MEFPYVEWISSGNASSYPVVRRRQNREAARGQDTPDSRTIFDLSVVVLDRLERHHDVNRFICQRRVTSAEKELDSRWWPYFARAWLTVVASMSIPTTGRRRRQHRALVAFPHASSNTRRGRPAGHSA